MGVGPVTSQAATVNLNGTSDTGTVVYGTVNGQFVGPAYIPSPGILGGVTSVGLTAPAALFSVAGSPITTAGTIAVSLATQAANTVFAGPASGGNVAPTFRALTATDIPAAYDATVVHLAGTETISGAKTFSAATTLLGATSVLQWTGLTQLDAPVDGYIRPRTSAGAAGRLLLGATGLTTGVQWLFGGTGTLAGVTTAQMQLVGGNSGTAVLYIDSMQVGAVYSQGGTPTNKAFSISAPLGTLAGLKKANQTQAATHAFSINDSGVVWDNSGAASQVTYTLPVGSAGQYYTFVNTGGGATFLKIGANGTDKIAQAGTLGSAGGTLTSAQLWSSVTVEWIASGNWQVTASNGTAWTLT